MSVASGAGGDRRAPQPLAFACKVIVPAIVYGVTEAGCLRFVLRQ